MLNRKQTFERNKGKYSGVRDEGKNKVEDRLCNDATGVQAKSPHRIRLSVGSLSSKTHSEAGDIDTGSMYQGTVVKSHK